MAISVNKNNDTRENDTYLKKITQFLKSNQKIVTLILVAICGISLIFLGSYDGNDSSDAATQNRHNDGEYDIIKYSEYLEKKIKDLCEHIGGVSNINVIVTLESGFEYVYAVNENGKTAEGYDYLVIKNGNKEEVVYLTGIPPQIRGIGIIYTVGKKDSIKHELINLVSATFDVGKNNIYVIERKK